MHAPSLPQTWIAATATRNYFHQDPLLDWLDLYGKSRGFVRDSEEEGYDPETDMGLFMREKGRAFEAAVMTLLRERFSLLQVGSSSRDAHDPTLVDLTWEAMRAGREMIYQPVLWDEKEQCFGMPDLLVRADILNKMVDIPALDSVQSKLDSELGSFHYRVVDIKFTNLDLSAKEMIGNDESDLRRKAQLLVYNRALARMQGYEPEAAYLIGRSFCFTRKGETYRGNRCFDRFGVADMIDPDLHRKLDEALQWIRRVRDQGSDWQVLPKPCQAELYPNMGNTQDSPWHSAKKQIAEQIGELTLLWNVTPKNRPLAHRAGVVTFSDNNLDPVDFGLKDKRLETLRKIIEINRIGCPDLIRPSEIAAGASEWRSTNPLEFYVDFETVSDLDDDFSKLPEKGGSSLIYMIGCGHMEDGKWRFRAFTCDLLETRCELEIIEAWQDHMARVRARLWPDGNPIVFHWSHAERSFLDTSYNSARKRHCADWPDLNWFDFLLRVMKEEPVTVKGALAFGLKAVAKAMHRNGLIQTEWSNGPGDGLAAMVGAWRCDAKARRAGIPMIGLPLMQSIERYNEVDCKVMQEIIAYLRAKH